jgi:hypothetical protein
MHELHPQHLFPETCRRRREEDMHMERISLSNRLLVPLGGTRRTKPSRMVDTEASSFGCAEGPHVAYAIDNEMCTTKDGEALTWVCVIDFEMGKVTACRAAERDQVSYPDSDCSATT